MSNHAKKEKDKLKEQHQEANDEFHVKRTAQNYVFVKGSIIIEEPSNDESHVKGSVYNVFFTKDTRILNQQFVADIIPGFISLEEQSAQSDSDIDKQKMIDWARVALEASQHLSLNFVQRDEKFSKLLAKLREQRVYETDLAVTLKNNKWLAYFAEKHESKDIKKVTFPGNLTASTLADVVLPYITNLDKLQEIIDELQGDIHTPALIGQINAPEITMGVK